MMGNSVSGRLRAILAVLREEYPDTVPLLEYTTPFQLLIAVILSAQTTDAGVNRVTAELFPLFPDPEAIAGADPFELERIIRPIGFFRAKAANIIKTARLVLDNFNGAVPREMEDLLSLPGVGRKTAGVLRAVLYGLPAIIVDTHFSRVMLRLGFTETRDPFQVEKRVAQICPEEDWTDLSQTVNRHGRRYCRARRPLCGDCPLRKRCPSAE